MAACPYCAVLLQRVPTRRTKCPDCGQDIYVKATPSDPVKRLVTASRAAEIEAEWSGQYAAQRVQDWAVAREAQLRNRSNLTAMATASPGLKVRFVAGPKATAPTECLGRDGAVFNVTDSVFSLAAPCDRPNCACCWRAVLPGWKSTTRGSA